MPPSVGPVPSRTVVQLVQSANDLVLNPLLNTMHELGPECDGLVRSLRDIHLQLLRQLNVLHGEPAARVSIEDTYRRQLLRAGVLPLRWWRQLAGQLIAQLPSSGEFRINAVKRAWRRLGFPRLQARHAITVNIMLGVPALDVPTVGGEFDRFMSSGGPFTHGEVLCMARMAFINVHGHHEDEQDMARLVRLMMIVTGNPQGATTEDDVIESLMAAVHGDVDVNEFNT